MAEVLQANWLLVVAALVIGLLVAWWLFVASRRTKVQMEEKEEAETGTARRNQALIDAPGGVAPSATDAQDAEAARSAASPGPTSAAANADRTAAAPLGTDAETGDGAPLRKAMKDVPPQSESRPQSRPGPESAPAPAPVASPAPAPAPSVEGDDLRRIKGVGPKLVTMLNEQGVTSFAQIAAWSDADIDRIDAQLGRFQGRIRRDNWVEQAKLLQSGDIAAYEERFGRTA